MEYESSDLDIREAEELCNAFELADSIVYRNYINRLDTLDIVEIPGCSDPFRRLFSTAERILLQDLESTRSVEHSDEKHSDSAIKNGKMPVQKRVENYAHD